MHECGGRITWEHALYYKGQRINEKYAIIPCCAKAHGVDFYQDSKNELPKKQREWVALNLINIDEYKIKYPKYNWEQRKKYLNYLFGNYEINIRNSSSKPGRDDKKFL